MLLGAPLRGGQTSAPSTTVTSPRPTLATFVDTSALFALLDRDDAHHQRAARAFGELRGSPLVTHSYVVVESVALTQSRLGAAALRRLCHDLLGVIEVEWVGSDLHKAALTVLLASDSLSVSLVDWVSFAFMRERGIAEALAFDQHFARQGFTAPRP